MSTSSAVADLGKKLLEASRKGNAEEVRQLMANGAPITTDWVRSSASTTTTYLHTYLLTTTCLLPYLPQRGYYWPSLLINPPLLFAQCFYCSSAVVPFVTFFLCLLPVNVGLPCQFLLLSQSWSYTVHHR